MLLKRNMTAPSLDEKVSAIVDADKKKEGPLNKDTGTRRGKTLCVRELKSRGLERRDIIY